MSEELDERVNWLRKSIPAIRTHQAISIATWRLDKLDGFRLLTGKLNSYWFDQFFQRIVVGSNWPSAEIMKNFPDGFDRNVQLAIAKGHISNENAELLLQIPIDEQFELLEQAKTSDAVGFEHLVTFWKNARGEIRRLVVQLRDLYHGIGDDPAGEEIEEHTRKYNRILD